MHLFVTAKNLLYSQGYHSHNLVQTYSPKASAPNTSPRGVEVSTNEHGENYHVAQNKYSERLQTISYNLI